MKKLTLLFLVLVLKFAPAKAQWVTIPDPNFVTMLQQLFPSCMNGNQMDTTCGGIVNATRINLTASNVSNLTGIQYFDNLNFLNFQGNQVSFFPTLPPLIDTLIASSNNITFIPYLPEMLKYFSCGGPSLLSLPNIPQNLKTLGCFNCHVANWPQLPDSLDRLFFNGSPNVIFPTFPNNLKVLSISSCQLEAVPVLPNSLEKLDCGSNFISSWPTLPQNLKELICAYNTLSELPPLPNNIETLNCCFNALTSLPQLPDSLKELHCYANALQSLPSLPNGLIRLSCSNNQLNSLPPIPNSIKWISMEWNQITNIPYLPLGIEHFYASVNQLNSLPLLPDSMLGLSFGSNNIACLINLPTYLPVSSLNINGNLVTCLPNSTNYPVFNSSVLILEALPVCIENHSNNPNNCSGNVNVNGTIYSDINGNCSFDETDLRASNLEVKLFDSQNNLKSTTYSSNGYYGFGVIQPGAYQVRINQTNYPISISCSESDFHQINMSANLNSINNLDFPVECDAEFDASVQSIHRSGWVFPGQIHSVYTTISNNFNYFNLNCNTGSYSGTVNITIDGPVTYVAPANGAITPTVNGNIFIYTISDFNTLNPNSFGLRLLTDTTAQATDQICVHVEISPNPTDADTTNNVYDFCYNVVNSYDPNMKEVYPVNVLPGYDDWFTYTIHFQNTGNAPAFNIRLRDTLDTQLDLNTFEVLGYSHPANVTVSGNILTVRFNNIMLPDSTSDYEGSMGYFQYRLKPLPNLPNGSQINNTAYIYFDYNAPIITNTTENNFDITVPVKSLVSTENSFSLYPNPSSGVFTFKDTKNLNSVEVYSILGEKILSQTNQKTINLNGFSKGVYFARVNGGVVLKLVKE